MKQRAWRRNEKVKHEPQHMNDRSPLRLIWLLLLVPYVGLLWVPFYNARTPELWGFPFFYWYQLIWVPITASSLIPLVENEGSDARQSNYIQRP
jgi:hypothetical protein